MTRLYRLLNLAFGLTLLGSLGCGSHHAINRADTLETDSACLGR
jgi:hypothetical protein